MAGRRLIGTALVRRSAKYTRDIERFVSAWWEAITFVRFRADAAFVAGVLAGARGRS